MASWLVHDEAVQLHFPDGVFNDCRIMKIGRKLAVGEVEIGGESQIVAGKPASHAIVTYAMPSE